MKVAVDTSALVHLAWRDERSEQVVDAFRMLDRPPLVVSDLILLETETAIRAKAFIEKTALGRKLHPAVDRAMKSALARLRMMQERGIVVMLETPWADWLGAAYKLGRHWAESHGARTMDILHLAFALHTKCGTFFTCDERQGVIARGEGLKVITV